MSASNVFKKMSVDTGLIQRIQYYVEKPGNKLKDLVSAERRDVDEIVGEMVYEVARGDNFDLDAYLAEEASKIHNDISAEFNEKEAALLVYRRASERVREKWSRVENLSVSNKSSDYQKDFSKAQEELGSIKYHLQLIDMINSQFNLEDFKGYDLADLCLIFENLNELGYINSDKPEYAAKKIIREDSDYLNELKRSNENVRRRLKTKQDILGSIY